MAKKANRKRSAQASSTKKARVRQHELVDRVMGGPTGFPARAQCIYGFLGKDSDAGFWRVYLSPQLDHYVRVAEADIVTVREAPATTQNERRDEVWIREDADLTETRAIPKQMRTSFLTGALVERLGASAYADVTTPYRRRPPVALGPVKPLTLVEDCAPVFTSYETGCGVNNPSADCGTYGFGCPITGPRCVDTLGPSCQSANPHCNSRESICLCSTRHRCD